MELYRFEDVKHKLNPFKKLVLYLGAHLLPIYKVDSVRDMHINREKILHGLVSNVVVLNNLEIISIKESDCPPIIKEIELSDGVDKITAEVGSYRPEIKELYSLKIGDKIKKIMCDYSGSNRIFLLRVN